MTEQSPAPQKAVNEKQKDRENQYIQNIDDGDGTQISPDVIAPKVGKRQNKVVKKLCHSSTSKIQNLSHKGIRVARGCM